MPPMIRRTVACAIVFGFLSLVRADPGAVAAGPPNPTVAMHAPSDLGAQDTGPLPGDLDTTFSGDGRQTTDFDDSDYGQGVAIQPDGKVVVVGRTYGGAGGAQDFALARYNPDGSLDVSFSGDGKQTTTFGEASMASAVALQADGKIVVVGVAGGNSYDFAVVRYNPNGELDPTFSGDGKQTTDFDGYTDAAYAVALQPDGKIVAVGIAGDDFGVARYNVDGTLDTFLTSSGFSGDGKQTTHLGASGYDSDYARAVAIQADGKIVVAGISDAFPPCDVSIDSCEDLPPDFALARYNTDGTLDTSFSGDGMLTTDFGGTGDGASGVSLQPDGKIVAAGAAGGNFALARYNSDGSLDETFGGGGLLTTQDSGAPSAVAFQPDGRIVAVGNAGGDFALARYNSDGSLDAAFSGTGTQTTDFGGSDFAGGVALQPDGKIVAVGGTWGATGVNFALARYHGGGGSLDTIPPDTTITGGPTSTTNDSTPTFSFKSSEVGSTFKCRVGVSTFVPCSSPHTTSTLSDGSYTFEVQATDAAGNAEPSAARRDFSVDTAPPETTITVGPTGTTSGGTPAFSFDSSESGSTFACRVDAVAFSACSSPHTTSPLTDGLHSFQVRATDGAGNPDPTPASRNWVIGPYADYRQVVLATSGLVSYWRLGETSGPTAADASGTHNGSYRKGVLLDRPGALLNDSNASASFDGSNDYVSVADSAPLDTGDSFTLEAWIKRSGVSSSTGTVLSKGNGSFRLSFVNSVLTLMKSNSGTIAKATVSTTDTGFHHVVATKSGGIVKLYIDGVDRTRTVTNRTIANTSAVLNIGRDTAGSEYFPGLIDEVAIYNEALSAAQVEQHFRASGR